MNINFIPNNAYNAPPATNPNILDRLFTELVNEFAFVRCSSSTILGTSEFEAGTNIAPHILNIKDDKYRSKMDSILKKH
ncbi:MAG: hypothetical protein JG776_1296 [Caloramator sp.]|jgi:hypothetical protein|nr:hypothetical protein [Caloramator sp.]